MGDLRRTRSVVRAVRDAGSARQSGATPHFHFGFGLSEIIHQHSCLISQSRQSKQSWHVEQSLHATAPPHAPDDPDTPTHHAQWEAIAHDRPSHPPQTPRRTDGGRQNPTHTGAAQTPYTSALARCGRRSPLGPISPFQRRRAATRRAEPVSAGDLGAARDAGMRDGSVGSVPKADRLGCELRQPPFLYLDHVQAVGGRAGWPRAGGGEGVRR